MAKPITVTWNGATSTFDDRRLTRERLYGKRTRVTFDPTGSPTQRPS